ncbi:MAG: hypothetical protein QXK52_00150 [Candidatus Bathyarchaeia archaeon]
MHHKSPGLNSSFKPVSLWTQSHTAVWLHLIRIAETLETLQGL